MNKKIQSALISVFYKDGLAPIAQQLQKLGITIYSTGGTQTFLENLGIACVPVERLTSYPSILGGRVKTLHPVVFGGILGKRDDDQHVQEMAQYKIPEIDLVIVDLYPFEETVLKASSLGGDLEEAEQLIIEKIDIGGPSMIRAAAKNCKDVTVIAAKEDYTNLEQLLKEQLGTTTIQQRKAFAAKAFEVVMNYDIAISNYFNPTKQVSVAPPLGAGRPEILDAVKEALPNTTITDQPRRSYSPPSEGLGEASPSEGLGEASPSEVLREVPPSGAINSKTAIQLIKEFPEATHPITEASATNSASFPSPPPSEGLGEAVVLRYGENPHQTATFYGDLTKVFTQLNGKELSYNNLVDVDAAIQLIKEFPEATHPITEASATNSASFPSPPPLEGLGEASPPSEGLGEASPSEGLGEARLPVFAIIKHTNVCGIAIRETVKLSWEAALAGDPESAFGGVLISNGTIDKPTAEAINDIFFEVLLAPAFDDEALTILKTKKNRILLQVHRQESTDDRQQTTLDRQPSTDSGQLISDNSQQSTVNNQQSSINYQQSTTNYQQSTVNNQLTTINYQQTTSRSLLNGTLTQSPDEGNIIEWKEVGGRESTQEEKENLAFANIVCKHLKSNAIVLVKNKQLVAKGVVKPAG